MFILSLIIINMITKDGYQMLLIAAACAVATFAYGRFVSHGAVYKIGMVSSVFLMLFGCYYIIFS